MKTQRGFVGVGVLIAIVLGLIVVGGGAYYVMQKPTPSPTIIDNTLYNSQTTTNTPAQTTPTPFLHVNAAPQPVPATTSSTDKYRVVGDKYVYDSHNPLASSVVTIANSTQANLSYSISAWYLDFGGDLGGVALRVTSTSSVVYRDETSNPGCVVQITLVDSSHLFYTTQDASSSFANSCNQYHGGNGRFFDNDVHLKNGSIILSTLKDLGFTDDDIAMYEVLLPKSTKMIQGYLNRTIEDKTGKDIQSTVELHSSDILDATGYSVQSPDDRTNTFACDFSDFSHTQYCKYSAFLKDTKGHYWVMSTNPVLDKDPLIRYATNDSDWKKKLPSAFQIELQRLNIDTSFVGF